MKHLFTGRRETKGMTRKEITFRISAKGVIFLSICCYIWAPTWIFFMSGWIAVVNPAGK